MLEIGSDRLIKRPEDEWTKIPNHHPAIISTELFDEVRITLENKGAPLRKRVPNTSIRYADAAVSTLKDKVVCGHCGHAMQLSRTKNAAFQCKFGNVSLEMICYRHRVLRDELEGRLFAQITESAQTIEKSRQAQAPSFADDDLASSVGECENEYRVLYERFLANELSAEQYKIQNAALAARIARMRKISNARLTASGASVGIDGILDAVFATKTLTQELSDLLIEKVTVQPNGDTEILWKHPAFKDALQIEKAEKNSA